jgi:hypothetical protein
MKSSFNFLRLAYIDQKEESHLIDREVYDTTIQEETFKIVFHWKNVII